MMAANKPSGWAAWNAKRNRQGSESARRSTLTRAAIIGIRDAERENNLARIADDARGKVYAATRFDTLINDGGRTMGLYNRVTGTMVGEINLSTGRGTAFRANVERDVRRAETALGLYSRVRNLRGYLDTLNRAKDIPARRKVERRIAALERSLRRI